MFNSMKSQLKEKTGRDIQKFTPQKGGLSRQSRQGSESSICSLVDTRQTSPPGPSSSPDPHQIKLTDGKVLNNKEVNYLAKKEEEYRNKMDKKEMEWAKKLEKRETELLNSLALKEEEWRIKEHSLTEDLLKQTNELKDTFKLAEEYKRKLTQYQDDKDTVESFQTQEMSKIKHLLLSKEKECTETSVSLKEASSLIENLKAEINRLRPFEEKISNFEDDLEMLRHTSEKERCNLTSKLAQAEEQVRHLTDKVTVLQRHSESDAELVASLPIDERIQAFLGERALLERRLEEAHVHLADIKASWSTQIASLETQVGRLSRQAGEEGSERRRAETKVAELETKLDDEINEKKTLSSRVTALTQECSSLSEELKSSNAIIVSKDEEILLLKKQIQEDVVLSEMLKEANNILKLDTDGLNSKLNDLENKLTIESASMSEEINKLKRELLCEAEKVKRLEPQLEKEKIAKDEAVFKIAQMSQEVDMVKKDLWQQQVELDDNIKKVTVLEGLVEEKEQQLKKIQIEFNETSEKLLSITNDESSYQNVEKGLRDKIADLEEQVTEKNKAIKIMKQKMADMKKTIQRELKTVDIEQEMNNHNSTVPSNMKDTSGDNEVNFLYMKNVIMKFLTSREYEAMHLTKAVATLLKLTAEEESLLKDTIGWRMSWFRPKPRLEDYAPS